MRDTIDMAREAGILGEFDTAQDIIECGIEVWLSGERGVQTLERFAELIRADEREACAKVCENNSASYSERASRPEKVRDINPEVARVAVQTCGHVAAAIRARGNT